MKHKILMTLALLITAVTGAWADYTVTWEGTTLQGIAVRNNTATTSQTVEGITVTASKGDFFYNTTYPKGPVVTASSYADNGLVFSAENNIKSIAITFTESAYYGGEMAFEAGAHTYQVSPAAKSFALSKNDSFIGITKVVFTLEGDAAIELKPDETGKNWILADMPASDIELQVEYYPESYLFLSKEALADKGSIAVKAGDLGVQFGEDGKSANPVAEGTAMTVKYNGTKKILGMKVGKYNPDPKAVPLTFEVLTNGTIKVSFPRNGMKYSLNGGEKTAVPGGSESDISVKAGDIIEFYGNGSSYYNMGSDHTSIGGTAEVKVYGNIMSLLSETNFATATTLTAEQTFRELFRSYSKLTDASGLLLPAMTLTNNCYYEMFYSCSGMTAAPAELPAETLASSCYYEMFSSCSKLTTAPVLPATSLVSNCYRSMFSYCSKLSSVTCLATSGIDSNYSTYNWMQSAGWQAAGDKTFTADKTAEWPNTGNGIPSGWTRVDYVAPGN